MPRNAAAVKIDPDLEMPVESGQTFLEAFIKGKLEGSLQSEITEGRGRRVDPGKRELCMQLAAHTNLTIKEICNKAQISPATFANWNNKDKDFKAAIRAARGEFLTHLESFFVKEIKRIKAPSYTNRLDMVFDKHADLFSDFDLYGDSAIGLIETIRASLDSESYFLLFRAYLSRAPTKSIRKGKKVFDQVLDAATRYKKSSAKRVFKYDENGEPVSQF